MDSTLKKHAFSLLQHSLELIALSVCISIEYYIFLNKWDPTFHFIPISCMLVSVHAAKYFFSGSGDVYLVDFTCLRPPAKYRIPIAKMVEHLTLAGCFDEESVAFMAKVMTSSGIGEEACLPPTLHYLPPITLHRDSVGEAEMLFFPVLDDLFSKTGVSPVDVDVLVVNCSGFCPAPSLSSIVVNRYRMRHDVRTFTVSGMGCSANVIAVDVARGLLKAGSGSYAVALSTEILSTGWYNGRDRRKLFLNCYFRTGCAAVLLTNKRDSSTRPKYRLTHMVRTHRGFDDRSYLSSIREEDGEGITGFTVERELFRVIAETLRSNAFSMGAAILPAHQKLRYTTERIWKEFIRASERAPNAPVFGSAVQHYCIPASGIGVIDEIGRGLGVGEKGTEAARVTFRRFGNQSSAAMWYQLAYHEFEGRVREGDRVWMLGLGSGPKCNSVVLECIKGLVGKNERGPWG